MEIMIWLFLVGTIFGFMGIVVAQNKRVNPFTGFLLGALLGPIGLIIVALLNPGNELKSHPAFSGERDLASDRYRVWLVQRYEIKRNETLGRYLVGGDSHETLEEALLHAHNLEPIYRENNIRRPLSPQDSIYQTLGCRHFNANFCENNASSGRCAFVRDDGVCITPPKSWSWIYKELGGK
jgi:hypothetical protein